MKPKGRKNFITASRPEKKPERRVTAEIRDTQQTHEMPGRLEADVRKFRRVQVGQALGTRRPKLPYASMNAKA
jgi:hypothetical protein